MEADESEMANDLKVYLVSPGRRRLVLAAWFVIVAVGAFWLIASRKDYSAWRYLGLVSSYALLVAVASGGLLFWAAVQKALWRQTPTAGGPQRSAPPPGVNRKDRSGMSPD
jgi:hypothetical protein